jgi:hypothetical protein
MLKIRPTCENCGAQLSPNSLEALICSFECTFCRTYVDEILDKRMPELWRRIQPTAHSTGAPMEGRVLSDGNPRLAQHNLKAR